MKLPAAMRTNSIPILFGTRRFNELRWLMPEISHKVLAATLRSLEHEGLICRKVYPEVPLAG